MHFMEPETVALLSLAFLTRVLFLVNGGWGLRGGLTVSLLVVSFGKVSMQSRFAEVLQFNFGISGTWFSLDSN